MHDTSPATAQTRVAIVSGAGGGLGAAIVQRLAADGFAVATCDLGPAERSALHAELDVVDRGAVGAFVARVEAELGPPGVVVTAAGVQRTGRERDGRRSRTGGASST